MRTKACFLVGLLVVAALAPAFAGARAWVLYTHPDKLMSARFPAQPNETEQEVPSAVGPIRFKLAMFADDTRTYLATAIQYPVKGKFTVKGALDGARDQALANIKGKIVAEKSIKLDGYEGREVSFEADTPDNQRVRGALRIFASAKPPSAFVATAMRITEKPDPEAQKFLDSIHLGKKAEIKK
ncbi:MAG TPA: hypothetical protein VIX73_30560 [Kofleriaceae bacterium]